MQRRKARLVRPVLSRLLASFMVFITAKRVQSCGLNLPIIVSDAESCRSVIVSTIFVKMLERSNCRVPDVMRFRLETSLSG